MAPRRRLPVNPSEHMSVGGNHDQYGGSSGSIQTSAYQSNHPLAGNRRSTRNVFPRIHDTPHVSGNPSIGPYASGRSLEDGTSSHDNCDPGQSPGHSESPQRFDIVSASRRSSQSGSDDESQSSSEEENDEAYFSSDEEPIHKDYNETEYIPRKRYQKPLWESELSKRLAAVPGGAGHNQGQKGRVRIDEFGGLQYWHKEGQRWMPAVYHYQIRDKLINMAQRRITNVYSHPRASGSDPTDVTAFLESQRDWDLERDNGWTGVEFLFDYSKVYYQGPCYVVPWMYHDGRVVLDLDNNRVKAFRDIPLTLSSQVEGGLLEAIRQLDPRITWPSLWARLPVTWDKRSIVTINALSARARRFRRENCIPSWEQKKGSREINRFIKNLMSPAALAANSTRELSKLTQEQLKQVMDKNKGKHDANAGGYSLQARARLTTQDGPSTKRKRPSKRTRKGKQPQQASKDDVQGANERQPPFCTSGQTHAHKKQRSCDTTASVLSTSQPSFLGASDAYIPLDPLLLSDCANGMPGSFASSSGTHGSMPTESALAALNLHSPPPDAGEGSSSEQAFSINTTSTSLHFPTLSPHQERDYRAIPPRTAEDISDIQNALLLTRMHYSLRTGSEAPPTHHAHSYFSQLNELLSSFDARWRFGLVNPLPAPDLVSSREPWRGGFKDAAAHACTGGDEAFFYGGDELEQEGFFD